MNLRPRRSQPPDINVTSLVDVVLLLLIYFMVATTFKDDARRIKVQLPQAQGEAVPATEPQVLDITIDREGRFYVNQHLVVDRKLATLKKAIAGAAGDDRGLPVVIKADANTPHQAVMTVMDAASQLGLLHFAFAATRSDESP